MHSNDTHANLANIARKVTAVKEVRAKKPNALLLDAGDVFSGTLYFNEFKGQADLAFNSHSFLLTLIFQRTQSSQVYLRILFLVSLKTEKSTMELLKK